MKTESSGNLIIEEEGIKISMSSGDGKLFIFADDVEVKSVTIGRTTMMVISKKVKKK